jgi:hypothetical protein
MSRFISITNSEMKRMLDNLPSSLNIGSLNKSPPGKKSKSKSPPGKKKSKTPSPPGRMSIMGDLSTPDKSVSKKRHTKQKIHKSLPIKSLKSNRSSSAPKSHIHQSLFKTPKTSLRGMKDNSIPNNSNFSNLINDKSFNSKNNKIAWQKLKGLTRGLRKGQLKGDFKNKKSL